MKPINETTRISIEISERIFSPDEDTINSYAIATRYYNYWGQGIFELYVPKFFGRYFSVWRGCNRKSPPEITL